MFTVKILPNNKEVQVQGGSTLLTAIGAFFKSIFEAIASLFN